MSGFLVLKKYRSYSRSTFVFIQKTN